MHSGHLSVIVVAIYSHILTAKIDIKKIWLFGRSLGRLSVTYNLQVFGTTSWEGTSVEEGREISVVTC